MQALYVMHHAQLMTDVRVQCTKIRLPFCISDITTATPLYTACHDCDMHSNAFWGCVAEGSCREVVNWHLYCHARCRRCSQQ